MSFRMPILRGLAACAIAKPGVKASAALHSNICLRFIGVPPWTFCSGAPCIGRCPPEDLGMIIILYNNTGVKRGPLTSLSISPGDDQFCVGAFEFAQNFLC